jgi:hypothetical protein
MIECLEQLLAPSSADDISRVEIIVDPHFVRLHGADTKATTRRNRIYVRDCASFLNQPCTILEEYYHVIGQWGRGMGYADYVWGWRTGGYVYEDNRYEVEAKFFAAEYSQWFYDCANLECDNELTPGDIWEYCGFY